MMCAMTGETISYRALATAAVIIGALGLASGLVSAAEPIKPRMSAIGLDGSALRLCVVYDQELPQYFVLWSG